MPNIILIPLTVVILMLLTFGMLNFPYVFMLFGIYENDNGGRRGKVIAALLKLTPIVTLLALSIAWIYDGVARFACLIPLFYILFIWFNKPNKQDNFPHGRRFFSKNQNIDEQTSEENSKWTSWENNPSPHYLYFEFWVPDKQCIDEIIKDISVNGNDVKFTHFFAAREKAMTLQVYLRLPALNRESIRNSIQSMVDIAWKHNSELTSTEVETNLPQH